MARPKAADAQQTRVSILNAAEDAFAESGFSGARMTAIAKAAGVTHALLHYYFNNKETLYAQVVDRLFGRHLQLIVDRLKPPIDRVVFRETVLAGFDLFWEHPNQVRIMLWEMAASDDRVERAAKPFFDALIDALPELDQRSPGNEGARHDRRDVYASLLGAVVVYFFGDPTLKLLFGDNRFTPEDRNRRREHLGALVDLFF